MTDKYSTRFLAYSFYPLALCLFISVSLIPIYHVLTVLAFVLLFKNKEINFKSLTSSAWALIAFVAVQFLSALVNINEMQDVGRSFGTLKYPLFGIMGLLMFQKQDLQQSDFLKKHARLAFNLFIITMWVAFIFSAVKVYSGLSFFNAYYNAVAEGKENTRFSGFTDIMRYGYGSGIAFLVIVACFLNVRKYRITQRSYIISAIIVAFAAIFFSYTRGAMLAILISTPVIFYFFNKRLSIILSGLSILIIGSMAAVSFMGGSESSRFLQNSNSSGNKMRTSQYYAAFYAFQEKPVLGFGPQQLKFHVKEIKEKHDLPYPNFESHAHNIYLQIAADSGIIGLISFLIFLGLWAKEVLFSMSTFGKQMFLPVILFLLIAGQFEMLFMAQTSTLIFFIYALSQLNVFKKETV